MSDALSISARYAQVRKRIAELTPSGRIVTLIAVSKAQPIEAIEALYALGHRDFGENYAQELIEKAQVLESKGCSGIRWHFIGHLQTNKAKAIIPHIWAIHSVDSEKLAKELAKRWRESGREGKLGIFLELNMDSEPSKAGVPPALARTLASQVAYFPELSVEGLMCIPAPVSPESVRTKFAELRRLEESLRPLTSAKLSMGMSADYEIAVQEGSTHVRVGTTLFGPRPQL